MTRDDQHVHPRSEIDLAIDRAFEAAKLQAGDAATSATVEHREPSAVEVDGDAAGADGD